MSKSCKGTRVLYCILGFTCKSGQVYIYVYVIPEDRYDLRMLLSYLVTWLLDPDVRQKTTLHGQ